MEGSSQIPETERAALVAICQPGSSYADAARQLGIKERRLRGRLERLYRRLGVNSAAQARHALELIDSQN